jgi:hypothetical protein
MVDDMTGREYQIVPDTLSDGIWPGDLTVEVSAEVCGRWSAPARMTLWVG